MRLGFLRPRPTFTYRNSPSLTCPLRVFSEMPSASAASAGVNSLAIMLRRGRPIFGAVKFACGGSSPKARLLCPTPSGRVSSAGDGRSAVCGLFGPTTPALIVPASKNRAAQEIALWLLLHPPLASAQHRIREWQLAPRSPRRLSAHIGAHFHHRCSPFLMSI